MQSWQLVLILALFLGYAGLSHYSSSNPEARGLGAGLSVGPVLLIGLLLLARWTNLWVGAVAAVAVAAGLYRFWPSIKQHFEWADLAQMVGIFGFLALGFARSLLSGRVPMCTELANKLHGPLLPAEIRYTRYATLAWAVLYVLITLGTLLLFFFASRDTWSIFVNFISFGLMLLMFIVDHALRLRLLPHANRSGILAALRQFLIG